MEEDLGCLEDLVSGPSGGGYGANYEDTKSLSGLASRTEHPRRAHHSAV